MKSFIAAFIVGFLALGIGFGITTVSGASNQAPLAVDPPLPTIVIPIVCAPNRTCYHYTDIPDPLIIGPLLGVPVTDVTVSRLFDQFTINFPYVLTGLQQRNLDAYMAVGKFYKAEISGTPVPGTATPTPVPPTPTSWFQKPVAPIVFSSNITATASQMIHGGLFQHPNSDNSARTITTDTATAIVSAYSAPQVGSTFYFTISNVTSNRQITLVGGTGVTLVQQNVSGESTQDFTCRINNVITPSVTCY